MTLSPGTRLGPYEITAAIGAGGMGEVLRARDTKLDRDVAIKVLPSEMARDPEHLARFEREAKLLASLNHPNIAHVYGFESATLEDGATGHFLAMELVEGEDLAERLKRGPIAIEEAIAIGMQIAEAVEEAHEHGIVHRDLKPANVKVAPDGKVKVLDFGLAKAYAGEAAPSSPDLSQSPTLAHTGTQAGVILGTAAYMSPEQARGKAVDKRADIWSFGVILFEMLTGERLFSGETVSDVLAAVLTRNPNFQTLPARTPRAIRELLVRCLERDPKERMRDIGEARQTLSNPNAAANDGDSIPAAPAPSRTWALPWIAAALGISVGLFGLLRTPARPTAVSSAVTLRLTLLPDAGGDIDGFPAVAPDGQTIVIGLVPENGVSQLWTISLTTGESHLLPDTEYGTDPFWSPDGRSIGFFARGKLRRLELSTGLSRTLADASDPRGGTWSESGDIIFTPNSAAGLFRVPKDGGAVTPVTELDTSREETHRYPTALPGGQALLYSIMGGEGGDRNGIFWQSLKDGSIKNLTPEISRVAYDARGYLLWVRKGTLVAQKVDPAEGTLSGEPFPIGERVGTDTQRSGKSWFGAAASVVVIRRSETPARQLRWFDRAGTHLADLTPPGLFAEQRISPDGKQVATMLSPPGELGRGDIWIFEASGKDRGRRLTFGGSGTINTPDWMDEGRAILFASRGVGGSSMVRKLADGSGSQETVSVHPEGAFLDSVSPREPLAALEVYNPTSGEDIWLLPLDGERKARPFLNSPAGEGHAAFSPDGRLLAYTSDESGLPQVYAKEIGGSGNRWQLTTDGGDQALWRADGKEIFYVGFDRVLRALPVRSLAPLAVGDAVKLFKLPIPTLAISGTRSYYWPSSDGRRFLVNALLVPESEPGLRLIVDWAPPGGEAR